MEVLSVRLPSMVHLLGVTYEETQASRWREWLSDEERALVQSFGAETRRREFLAGRAAARRLLGEHLEMTPGRVPLRRAGDGAVEVDVSGWSLTIAHSGPHAVAACAPYLVGIDLEGIQPRDSGILDFLFHPWDRGIVESMPYGADAALVLCWALKESVLKARRSGFRTSPKALQLDVEPDAERASIHVEGGEAWTVYYTRIDGYWATVAVPNA